MKRTLFILFVLAVIGGGAGLAWWYLHRPKETNELVLYGNVDLRQAQLAFIKACREGADPMGIVSEALRWEEVVGQENLPPLVMWLANRCWQKAPPGAPPDYWTRG